MVGAHNPPCISDVPPSVSALFRSTEEWGSRKTMASFRVCPAAFVRIPLERMATLAFWPRLDLRKTSALTVERQEFAASSVVGLLRFLLAATAWSGIKNWAVWKNATPLSCNTKRSLHFSNPTPAFHPLHFRSSILPLRFPVCRALNADPKGGPVSRSQHPMMCVKIAPPPSANGWSL